MMTSSVNFVFVKSNNLKIVSNQFKSSTESTFALLQQLHETARHYSISLRPITVDVLPHNLMHTLEACKENKQREERCEGNFKMM